MDVGQGAPVASPAAPPLDALSPPVGLPTSALDPRVHS